MAINFDTFLIAKTKIEEQVPLPTYYHDYIDAEIDLDSYNKDCCPLHDEDSPSFFYFGDGRFHCFGCDKFGKVSDLHYFVQQRNDPSYTRTKAVLDLAKLYNIDIPNIFKSVTLDDAPSSFFKTEKIPFKKREELTKPTKKMKTETEKMLKNAKANLPVLVYKKYVDEFDSILFRDSAVEKEIKLLQCALRLEVAKNQSPLPN